MKRGILYLQMKYFEQALEDFNKLTDISEESGQTQNQSVPKAYFYKGKALKKMGNFNDAILHFE
jgi:tetratricopeptide (TPR) repeat protein